MSDRLVNESPLEFFREQVDRAMEHQKVATSAFTQLYLANLLTGCVNGELAPSEPGYDETPLAILYVRALQASRFERARLLRILGDTALFVSGFFPDSVSGKLVDLDYYKAMGGHAYGRLSQETEARFLYGGVFSELADRFTQFTDVLAEVSEQSRLGSNRSLLRLYERWILTGSRRDAALLAQRGMSPLRGEGRPQ
jgi:hypothetical protein